MLEEDRLVMLSLAMAFMGMWLFWTVVFVLISTILASFSWVSLWALVRLGLLGILVFIMIYISNTSK